MPEWNPRANEIFLQAVEIASPTERATFLDRQCGGDATLRAEVESLLAASVTLGSFLESPVVAVASDIRGRRNAGNLAPTTDMTGREQPGSQIGRYKLRELIGEGGMGTVWIAEQTEPVRRKVALKLVKPGMDTKEVLSRFEVERQALALMDHPNIAKVHDGGVTTSGRPFFVMEYVKGIPITQFCDDAKLTVRERLDLFVQVCQAVQHAHQKGIIHRDLKPSNILVCLYDGRPIPKIIDFGLAKAMHQPLTENTLYTAHGMMVGTPLYMSPEQAEFNNLDVDTRTDIYSLGVVLYELLTGTTPLERKRFKDAALQEILRLIKDEDPQKPSTKISGSGALPTIAAQRGLEPAQLSRIVQGDLDWIAMKALEKDRSRRYESASGLARDVQRYLDDEPVEACPPTLGYKLRKLARRNQRAIATAGMLTAVVLAALVVVAGSVGWAVRDRQNRQAVVEKRIKASLDEVATAIDANRLVEAEAALTQAESLLGSGDLSPQLATSVKQWKGDLAVASRLHDIEQGGVKGADGPVYGSAQAAAYQLALDEYGLDLAAPDGDVVAKIRQSPIRLQLLTALHDGALSLLLPENPNLAGTYTRLRDRWLALAALADDDAWRAKLRVAAVNEDEDALIELAAISDWQRQPPVLAAVLGLHLEHHGKTDEAERLLRGAAQRYPQDFRINRELGLHILAFHSPAYDAERYLHACIASRPESAEIRAALGMLLWLADRDQEAESELREAIGLQSDQDEAHYVLGRVLRERGDITGAEEHYRRAIQLDPTDYSPAEHLFKTLADDKASAAAAVIAFEEAVKQTPDAAPAHLYLGEALAREGNWAPAERAFREAIRCDPKRVATRLRLGQLLMRNERMRDAEIELQEAVNMAPDSADAQLTLTALLLFENRNSEARLAYQKAVQLDPEKAASLEFDNAAKLFADLNLDPTARLPLLKRGVGFAKSNDESAKKDILLALQSPPLDLSKATSGEIIDEGLLWWEAGQFLWKAGSAAEAEPALQRGLDLLVIRLRENPFESANANRVAALRVLLGSHSNLQGKVEKRDRHFREALRLDSNVAVSTHRELAIHYQSQGEWDAAATHWGVVIEQRPEDHLQAMHTAVLQLHRGDLASYERVCRRMLDVYRDTANPLEADRTAKACLLADPPVGEPEVLRRLVEVANADAAHWAYRYFILVEALAAYRRGEWQLALDSCRKGRAKISKSVAEKEAQYYEIPVLGAHYLVLQAMAEKHLGLTDAAESSLRDAEAIIMREFPGSPEQLGKLWADWMLYAVLQRQAKELLTDEN